MCPPEKYDIIQNVTNLIVAFEIKFSEAQSSEYQKEEKIMGIILAGILAAALLVGLAFLYMLKSQEPNEITSSLIIFVGIICLIGGVITGIIEPVSGYGEPEIVSTVELVSLRDETVSEGTGRLFYVSVSSSNSYTYYIEVDSSYASSSQKAYESKTISSGDVTIVEDDNATDAKLVKYVRHGKKSFWTFAVGAKQYEYVFYVPTGTIVRDVSLG